MTDIETTMRAYSSFLYLGHIVTIGAIPLLWMLPVPKWANEYKGDMKGAVVGTLQTKVAPAEALFYGAGKQRRGGRAGAVPRGRSAQARKESRPDTSAVQGGSAAKHRNDRGKRAASKSVRARAGRSS